MLTWNRPPIVLPGHGVDLAGLGDAAPAGRGELVGPDPRLAEDRVHRLEQAAPLIIGDHRLVHGDQIGRVAGRDLRGELGIAGPGDDVDVDRDIGILGLEAVDQGGQDAALAVRGGDVDALPVDRAAFAEEALDDDLGAAATARAAAEREQGEQRQRQAGLHHRTAVPAMARMICFWKMM